MYTTSVDLFSALLSIMLIIAIMMACLIYWMMQIQKQRRIELAAINETVLVGETTQLQKIAADLHDELGPILSSLQLQTSQLEHVIGDHKAQFMLIRECTEKIHDGLRKVVRQIMPPVLVRKGALFAIEDFVSRLVLPDCLQVKIYPFNTNSIGVERNLHLYRILQEVLNNAIKHSKAKLFSIEAEFIDEQLIVIGADDGKGLKDIFSLEEESRGMGLQNIKMRAAQLRATVNIEAAVNKGFRYEILIPINVSHE